MANIDSSASGDGATPAPPGWYQTELGQRYWDGSQWLSNPPSAPAGPMAGAGYQGAQPPGRPAYEVPHPSGISSDDRTMGMLAHLLGLVASGLAPLIIYITKRDQSPFVRHHAAEALNLFLTVMVVVFGSLVVFFGGAALIAIVSTEVAAAVFVAGYFLVIMGLMAVSIGSLVLTIIAGIAANRGEWYRVPFCFHWVK